MSFLVVQMTCVALLTINPTCLEEGKTCHKKATENYADRMENNLKFTAAANVVHNAAAAYGNTAG